MRSLKATIIRTTRWLPRETAVISTVVGAVLCLAPFSAVAATLAHRWSFNAEADGTDSIGGATCVLAGGATIADGALTLPGGGYHSDYGDISGIIGTLNANESLTIEAWITATGVDNWAKPWCFGEPAESGGAKSVLELTAQRGDTGRPALNFKSQDPAAFVNTAGGTPDPEPLVAGREYHITTTFDASADMMSLYLDGLRVDTAALGGQTVKGMAATVAWLGNSFWSGDPDFAGTINELRIYAGARSEAEVLLSHAAGPNVVPTSGTPWSLSLTVASAMAGGAGQQAAAVAHFDGVGDLPVTLAITHWATSDPNVITVSSSGWITAVGVGTATVSATFSGRTATSATIAVSLASPSISQQPVSVTNYVGDAAQFSVVALGGDLTYQWKRNGVNILNATNSTLRVSSLTLADNTTTYSVEIANAVGVVVSASATLTVVPVSLAHRWSFNTDGDGTDSVGGTACVLMGGATIADGALNLPGGGHSDYGDISGITNTLNANESLTIEAWITASVVDNWAKPWCFGEPAESGGAKSVLELTAQRGDTGRPALNFKSQDPAPFVNTAGGAPDPEPWVAGPEYHVVATLDAFADTMSLYVDGLRVDAASLGGQTVKGMVATVAWLGNSFWGGDPDFAGGINELRIYAGARSEAEVVLSHLAGPNVVPTSDTPWSLSLSVAGTMAGGAGQQAAAAAHFAGVGDFPVTSAITNWITSDANVITVNSSGWVTAVGAGTASVSATFSGRTATSASITVSVVPPSITQQPVSVTNYVGDTTRFSVVAAGGGLAYQWKRNSVDIPNATNSTLTMSDLTLADNATTYSVGITNAVGGVVSAGATLTVVPVSLAHRWSFNADGDGADSIGGVSCAVMGAAMIADGALQLPGGGYHSDYGDISGITTTLNANASLTVEAWLTASAVDNWAKPWCFGEPYEEGGAKSVLELTAQRGNTGRPALNFKGQDPAPFVNTYETAPDPEPWVAGREYHVVATFDASADLMSFYVDGLPVDAASMGGQKVSGMVATAAWLGNSFWGGDLDFAGSINEFRIYAGALNPRRVLQDFQAGPNLMVLPEPKLGIARTGANVAVTWSSGTLQAALAISGSWTNVPAAVSPYTTPVSGQQLFYRAVNP